MSDRDYVSQTLRAHGLRATPQRVIIYEVLAEVKGHQHLTAQEVFAVAQHRLPGLNAATVYRSLEDLTGAGIAEPMVTRADAVRFSLKNPEHQHCHLACRGCDELLEFSPELVRSLVERVKEDYGFTIDLPHLTFSGLCRRCAPQDRSLAPQTHDHHHGHGLAHHDHSHGHSPRSPQHSDPANLSVRVSSRKRKKD